MSLKKYPTVPVAVVDDHNEVLPFIHEAIGSKHLPQAGSVFVHLDAHPDLLVPVDMKADDVYNKHLLYSQLSIENWLVPLVYAGHVSEIIWIKPPWAKQISDGVYEFCVGKCKETCSIRVTCKENYFVSEALYIPETQLMEIQHLTLTVVTLRPDVWPDSPEISVAGETDFDDSEEEETVHKIDAQMLKRSRSILDSAAMKNTETEWSAEPTQSQMNQSETGLIKCEENLRETMQPVFDASARKRPHLEENSFSLAACSITTETFAESFSHKGANCQIVLQAQESRTKLSALLERFVCCSLILDIDLDFFSTKNPFLEVLTDKQYQLLKQIYRYTEPADKSDQSLMECVKRRSKQLKELGKTFQHLQQNPREATQLIENPDLKNLATDLMDSGDGETDFELVHDAGCTCDDTELPHHISTDAQISSLVRSVSEILTSLPEPTIITIARSSTDEYCPPEQVDSIQDDVIQMLRECYKSLDVIRSY